MCVETNNNSYGFGLTPFNGVRKSIFYMLASIFVIFYQWFYDAVVCGSLMQPPNVKAVYGNISPLLLIHMNYK